MSEKTNNQPVNEQTSELSNSELESVSGGADAATDDLSMTLNFEKIRSRSTDDVYVDGKIITAENYG